MLMIEGRKMSKSKGNFVTLRSAIDQYGADATRYALLLGAEDMDDPDWRSDNVRDVKNKLESFYRLAETIIQKAKNEEKGQLEDWLLSMMQHKIRTVTDCMETLKTRTAAENALFAIWNDFRWYTRRKGTAKSQTLQEALKIWLKLLAPFTPHTSEEIWSKMGENPFISEDKWPEYNESRVDHTAEEGEALIKSALDDTMSIVRATKITPERICYYTAAQWKWKVYRKALTMSLEKERISQSDLMRELMKDGAMKKRGKGVASFVSQIVEEINRAGRNRREAWMAVGTLDETAVLAEAENFLKRELSSEICVFPEDDERRYDPKNRSQLAKPYRPAIYIE
jgi:leucyl-tRNA synthetase